jgi:hypothetical protein
MEKESMKETLNTVLDRYKRYEKYLKYPGEWGERTFRAWLVFEIFHKRLKWPISKIVFGEVFDVLFVNETVKPVIYLETKKPERGPADSEAFQRHISKYETLEWAILTDGYDWVKMDCLRKKKQSLSLRGTNASELEEFLSSFSATNYLYGDQNVKDKIGKKQ